MITALDARRIVEISDSRVQSLLTVIEDQIRRAAEAGQLQVLLYTEGLWDSHSCYRHVSPTPIQSRVCAELSKLGFNAQVIKAGEPYVPRGLDEDTAEKQINHVIKVSW